MGNIELDPEALDEVAGGVYLPCAILIKIIVQLKQKRCTNDKYLIYISLP